jgi:hypothetical protein
MILFILTGQKSAFWASRATEVLTKSYFLPEIDGLLTCLCQNGAEWTPAWWPEIVYA